MYNLEGIMSTIMSKNSLFSMSSSKSCAFDRPIVNNTSFVILLGKRHLQVVGKARIVGGSTTRLSYELPSRGSWCNESAFLEKSGSLELGWMSVAVVEVSNKFTTQPG